MVFFYRHKGVHNLKNMIEKKKSVIRESRITEKLAKYKK